MLMLFLKSILTLAKSRAWVFAFAKQTLTIACTTLLDSNLIEMLCISRILKNCKFLGNQKSFGISQFTRNHFGFFAFSLEKRLGLQLFPYGKDDNCQEKPCKKIRQEGL